MLLSEAELESRYARPDCMLLCVGPICTGQKSLIGNYLPTAAILEIHDELSKLLVYTEIVLIRLKRASV
jgi:hypothetical protein